MKTKTKIIITIAIILLSIVIAVILKNTIFISDKQKIDNIIKKQDVLSKEQIEYSKFNINDINHKIDLLKEKNRLLNECLDYNNNRLGTIKIFKDCNIDILLSENKKNKITKEKNTLSKKDKLLLLMNLPKCRITQYESNHIKDYTGNPNDGGGHIYATDFACIKGKPFEVKASNHKDFYLVYSIGVDNIIGDFIVLKHGNRKYLFGHTKSNLTIGDRVDAGDVIGITTISGITSAYHLHFELWLNGNNINSNDVINPYNNNIKKQRGLLTYNNPNKRSIELLKQYGFTSNEANIWLNSEDESNVKRGTLICISKADTGLGKHLKTKYNFGNVGNTDGGSIRSFNTLSEGIIAIGKTLNNKLLINKKTIGSLSVGGGGTSPIYASSNYNWNYNVIDCLRTIYNDDNIDKNFMFRK